MDILSFRFSAQTQISSPKISSPKISSPKISSLKISSPKISSLKTVSAGFTLLELMVVVFIMGVLSAIAIPSFSNQARRAREAEAKITVSHINRAQQLYFVEHSQFGSLEDLELNLSPSPHYTYYSVPAAIDPPAALTTAAPEDPSLRGFAGKVWLTAQIAQSLDQKASRSILCEGEMGKVPEVDEASCTP